MVNIGENKGFGPQVFRVAIQDPRNVLDTLEIINLRNQSLATSAPKGGYIQDGVSHIFRGNGKLERPHMSVSVTHQRAVIADALATAFVHMPVRDIGKIVRTYGGLYVALVDGDGRFIKPY